MIGVLCLWALAGCIGDDKGLPATVEEAATRLAGSEEDECWLPDTLRKHPEFANAEHKNRKLTWIAISQRKRLFLDQLLEAGAAVDPPVAAFAGDIDWFEANVKNAAELRKAFEIGEDLGWTSGRESLLVTAIRGGQAKTLAYLLRRGGPLFEPDVKQGNLLSAAASWGDDECVDVLLKAGCTDYAEAARGIASEPSRNGMLADLVRRFSDLPKHRYPKQEGGLGGVRSHPPGSTLLMHAADNLGAVDFLLARGADANAKDAEGRNAIDYIGGRSPDPVWTARRLRAAGAEFSPWSLIAFGDVSDIEGAIRKNRFAVNRALKTYGDVPHLPLQVAWRYGRADIVATLLKRGADPFRAIEGQGSLVDWIGQGYLNRQCLAALLAALDAKGLDQFRSWRAADGGTMLHRAAEDGKVAAIRLLLKAGVEMSVKDKEGRTAADLACNPIMRKELQ